METRVIITDTPAATRKVGHLLGEEFEPGDVLLLTGPLGAGKTTLTKGIARGLGISETVLSPTFVLLRELRGKLPLYHLDLYRLESIPDIADLGLDDYFYGDGVTVVEWPERATGLLPDERMEIAIDYSGEKSRRLTLTATGERYMRLLQSLTGLPWEPR